MDDEHVDGRGGARNGAGRKSKADEQKIRKLGLDAINSVYGSAEEYYKHIATESKTSFPHLRLLQEYVYGKPKESIDLTSGDEPIQNFNLSNLSDKELAIILKLHAGQSTNTDEESD